MPSIIENIKATLKFNYVNGPVTKSKGIREFVECSQGKDTPMSERQWISDYHKIHGESNVALVLEIPGDKIILLDPSSYFEIQVKKTRGNKVELTSLNLFDFIPALANGPVELYPDKSRNVFKYTPELSECIIIGTETGENMNDSYVAMNFLKP